ncbi:MAG: protoporphyrinogen oxidase, partial [Microthrixaceae bacterium]
VWTPSGLKWFPAGSALGVPLDLGDLANTGLLSDEGMAGVTAEAGRDDPALTEDASVGGLLRQRFGDELVDRVVGPLVGGISAGDVDQMSMRACTPQIADAAAVGGSLTDELRRRAARAADGPVFHGLEGGTATLVDALVEQLTSRRAGLHVEAAAPTADPDELGADLVVLATSAATTARLVAPMSPGAAELLSGIETVSVVLVTLVFDAAELDAAGMSPPEGASGYLVPRHAGRFVAAVSWGSTKWSHWKDGNHVVLRASAGHRGDQRHLDMTDDEVVTAMLGDIAETSGLDARPLATRVSRWSDGFHQYDVGHLDLVDAIEAQLAADTDDRIRIAGAAYRGVGIPACIRGGRRSVT